MALRYSRATGNWNSTSTWSATSGGAAGASVPVAGDQVFLDGAYTVTVNADSACDYITHTNGTLSFSSNRVLTVKNAFRSSGSTARTINMSSGSIVVNNVTDLDGFILSGSNLTFNRGTSLIVLNVITVPSGGQAGVFGLLSKTFYDVKINLGTSTSVAALNITGSGTFRSLALRSATDAAHTITFDSESTIVVQNFIAIGYSISNRLNISQSGSYNLIQFPVGASCYGQFVHMGTEVYADDTGAGLVQYIGSGSTQEDEGQHWLLQNPPKISTFSDDFKVSPDINYNWSTPTYASATLPTAVTTGVAGGGYSFNGFDGLISADTYDIVDQDIILQIIPRTNNTSVEIDKWFMALGMIDDATSVYQGANVDPNNVLGLFQVDDSDNGYYGHGAGLKMRTGGLSPNIGSSSMPSDLYVKINLASTGYLTYSTSSDAKTWTLKGTSSFAVATQDLDIFRSTRLLMRSDQNTVKPIEIGSINVIPSTNVQGSFLPFFV